MSDVTVNILSRCKLDKTPQNPRERAELLGAQFKLAPEQVVKALALQAKPGGAAVLLLLPAAERLDLKVLSRVAGEELDYFPQEQIEAAFGAPMAALNVLLAAEKKIPVVADGRVFEQEKIAITSGNPNEDLVVNAEELRAAFGALKIVDLESAKQNKAGIIEPRTLKGFRDYLPEEMLPRQSMIGKIVAVFERFGFAPLQTPALEYSDILLGKLGGDAEKLLFRFRDNGGRDVCLRYDLTVPLARVAAQYPELPKPFKRYQIAPVWRAENPGRGRFREFFQCDCDIVGSPALLYDAECIALDFAVMEALGVNVEVRFNNRKVLGLLGDLLNFSGSDVDRRMATVFRTIDKLPSQGVERVRQLLAAEANCDSNQIDTIMKFVGINGTNEAMLAQLKELFEPNQTENTAIDELRRVMDYVAAQIPQSAIRNPQSLKLDFSIARGLDYYTGTVYETFLTDLPGFGSVMSGGRYDKLIERYLGKPMPAVGISVGIDRLFAGLIELGRIKASAVTSKVMVVPMDADCIAPALKVLGAFRAAGVAAEMALENEQKPKLDKQLSLAGKKGVPYAAILGGNEVAKGVVMLKDLNARQQEELTVEQAIVKLKI